MEQVRCASCNKLLARAVVIELEIKCPRCGTLNTLKVVEPPIRASRTHEGVRHENHSETQKAAR